MKLDITPFHPEQDDSPRQAMPDVPPRDHDAQTPVPNPVGAPRRDERSDPDLLAPEPIPRGHDNTDLDSGRAPEPRHEVSDPGNRPPEPPPCGRTAAAPVPDAEPVPQQDDNPTSAQPPPEPAPCGGDAVPPPPGGQPGPAPQEGFDPAHVHCELPTVGAAINGTWFDGRDYWLQVNGIWRLFRKADISLHMRVAHSISDQRRADRGPSQLDVALEQVHQTRCVDGAAPFVFRRDDFVRFGGKQYLNIARSRIVEPAAGPRAWGEGFPWIAGFLDNLFDPCEQLEFFLSWFAYAYRHALAGTPRNGQVIYLAGDVNQGKTLASNVLIGELFGGHMDASDYLLGESRFNKELFEVGLWTVDDTVPSSDPRKQQLYSAMLKKIPANYAFSYHPKFRDQILLPWAGRVVVTCNADPESIRILPDIEMSMLDKICLFLIRTADRDFHGAADHIRAEHPAFARWLHDYEIPPHCQGSARFGVRCYHHPALMETARQSGRTAGFIELLERFLRSWFELPQHREWTGTATDLLASLMSESATRDIACNYTPDKIGRRLSQLMGEGYPINYNRESTAQRSRTWAIGREALNNQAPGVGANPG